MDGVGLFIYEISIFDDKTFISKSLDHISKNIKDKTNKIVKISKVSSKLIYENI